MLTARPYQEYVFGVATGTLPDRALDWTQLVFVQFNPLGLFIGLMAVGPLRTLAPRFFYPSLASMLVLSIYSITYATFDFQVLMVPAFFVFAVWLGVGFFWLVSTSVRDFASQGEDDSRWLDRITAAHQAAALSVLAFALLPVLSLVFNYGSQDRSGDRGASENAAEIMAAVPDGSVVLSHSEQNVFSLWYMRYVETPERDVAVIATPLLQFDWYLDDIRRMFPDRIPTIAATPDLSDAMRSIAQHNVGKAGVYSTFKPAALTERFELEQQGRVYEVKAR